MNKSALWSRDLHISYGKLTNYYTSFFCTTLDSKYFIIMHLRNVVHTGTFFNFHLFDTPGSWVYDIFKLDKCVFRITFPPVPSHLSQYQGCSPLHSVINKSNQIYIPVIIFCSVKKNVIYFDQSKKLMRISKIHYLYMTQTGFICENVIHFRNIPLTGCACEIYI